MIGIILLVLVLAAPLGYGAARLSEEELSEARRYITVLFDASILALVVCIIVGVFRSIPLLTGAYALVLASLIFLILFFGGIEIRLWQKRRT